MCNNIQDQNKVYKYVDGDKETETVCPEDWNHRYDQSIGKQTPKAIASMLKLRSISAIKYDSHSNYVAETMIS